MKKLLFALIVSTITITIVNAQETAKVYFIRPSVYSGREFSFICFIDDVIVCKIDNARHSVHEVAPGKHTLYMQLHKKKLIGDKNIHKMTLTLESGKIYYLQVHQTPLLLLERLTEASGEEILKKTKLHTKCE